MEKKEAENTVSRIDRDLPMPYVLGGIILLVIAMITIPNIPLTITSAIIVVIAGFIFVSVSSRIVGLIGQSSNPISGMTIATLMGTCLFFIANGWSTDFYQPIALCVGGIVAIAAANAGATAQDLKTGFLVGATPSKQQLGIMIGVVASASIIGLTIILLKDSIGIGEITPEHPTPLPAPQATLMATIIKGLFDQSLPWSLVLIGMGIAAVIELCGVSSLAFSIGTYLPLSTTAPIFVGGLIKWFVKKNKRIKAEESELESGALFSSGLIAGGALTGILVAALIGTTVQNSEGKSIALIEKINTHIGEHLGLTGDLLALGCFLILCLILYFFGVKKEDAKVD
jgi:putative OPT family oligopeptide transporter